MALWRLSEMLGIVLRNEGLDVVHCANETQAMALFRESRSAASR